MSTPLEDAAPAAYPVGCSAWYAPSTDRGYVFGGLSGAEAAFSSTTWRWDPDARAFTALDIEGPPGRYDAAVHALDDGDLLLASGMGLGAAVVFYDDVWRFDAQAETWSRLDAVGEAPPGRRYAWSAVSPDETLLLFGFGSDSPTGQSLLGDLWVFDLETRTWAPAEVDGAMPEARGFTPNWQVAEGEPGVLAFGANAVLQVLPDVFILRAPEGLKGRWK